MEIRAIKRGIITTPYWPRPTRQELQSFLSSSSSVNPDNGPVAPHFCLASTATQERRSDLGSEGPQALHRGGDAHIVSLIFSKLGHQAQWPPLLLTGPLPFVSTFAHRPSHRRQHGRLLRPAPALPPQHGVSVQKRPLAATLGRWPAPGPSPPGAQGLFCPDTAHRGAGASGCAVPDTQGVGARKTQ